MRDLVDFEVVAEDTDDLSFDSKPVIAVAVGSWQTLIRTGTLTDFYDTLERDGVMPAIYYLHCRDMLYQQLQL
jgi:hypothetical protein